MGGQPVIRNQVISSVKWLGSARLLGQGTAAVISVVVVRLLDPADYGVMAIVMVFLGLVLLLNEMGLGAALVQQETLDKRELEQVFGLLILVNLALYGLIYVSAPLIATFFEEPRVTPIIRVVALRLPMIALLVIPRAMLRRNLRFRPKSMVDLAGMITASGATLVMALLGFGVWSLACGVLFGALVEVAGMYIATRMWVWPRFSMRGMRRQATFGGYLTLDRLLWYAYSQSDKILIGRLLGNEALGFYYIAKKFAWLPVEASGGIFTEVGFAAYSRTQHDRERFRENYCKVARMASLLSVPACLGLSAVAPVAVPLIFGERWIDTVLPLQFLALVAPLRQLNALNTPALLGIGRPDVNVVNLLIAIVIMPTAFFLGTMSGLVGVAIAWAVAYPLYFVIVLGRSLPVIGVPFSRYFDALWPPWLAAVVMYVAVTSCRLGLGGLGAAPVTVLLLCIAVGVCTYLGAIRLLRRQLFEEIQGLLRR